MAKAAREDPELRKYSLEGFALGSGETLPAGAVLAYRVYGAGPKVAVAGTSYGVAHTALKWHYGRTIDESFTFVAFNLMGNGVSFSPSTCPEGYDYPAVVDVRDNVRAQKKALDADPDLRGRTIDLVFGFSMGAMQAFEWARAYPECVEVAAPICGSSGCEDYNKVFLEGLVAILEAPTPTADKLKTFGAVYAGWYVGPDFYRLQHWTQKGFTSLQDWLDNFAQKRWNLGDPDDFLAMVKTWRHTAPFSEDDMKAITHTKVLILPCDADTYFRVEAIADRELKHIPNATMKVIPSSWGHLAGNPESLPDEFHVIKSNLDLVLSKAP
eukprot:CAMPEP_0118900176 /NCGR_PEP_ID=MMETSP1166-20130328/6398_1 /TAXON_ID=1104430 /ORGANISM="Chrysoreinhardia sp, Strain CCMP3193" /LENGTH=325 /DNA_ID=CAMNT_0006839313 /DNA_START=86 /DNA_END=1063 /DNA_ORIENTATION=-